MDKPLICFTAGGLVVRQRQVLLVHHKKLGIWLAPGGHLETDELPHEAALREVFEETGITAKIISSGPQPTGSDSQYLPVPFLVNLHWVAQENYQSRIASNKPTQPQKTATWPRGCEQHLVWLYLMEIVGNDALLLNKEESLDIGWFGIEELDTLVTTEDIKTELKLALSYDVG